MKKHSILVTVFPLVFGLLCILAVMNTSYAQADTRYVKESGTGDGSSWATASGTLQAMIDAVEVAGGGTVCAASGTYAPVPSGQPGTRTDSFAMRNGVGIYGGFPSTGSPVWAERDWESNVTTLSGDIGTSGDDSDNCYHVFYHPDGTNLNNSAVLDGFTITGGNADNLGYPKHVGGGGMYNDNVSPTLANCTFSSNSAIYDGGGIYNSDSYPMINNCTFASNSATVYGGGIYNDYSDPVLIDCVFSDNCNSGMYNSYSSPTITNCTFYSNSTDRYHNGGGMNNDYSSPVIDNCTFSDNMANYAGGIYNSNSDPAITNCAFSDNMANYGGGIYNWRSSFPVITGCTFSGNSAKYYGGGICNRYSSPDITACIFSYNLAQNRGGGAMYNRDSSPTITNCTFSANSTDDNGGGIYNWRSSFPVITGCTFSGNSAKYYGGGICNRYSSPDITACIFSYNLAQNRGGGMHNCWYSSPVVINCTFYNNQTNYFGGGISSTWHSNPIVTNCILRENAPDEIHPLNLPDITYSNVKDVYNGTGNISGTPMFVDPKIGDFRLLPDSPCINAGTNSVQNLPEQDFEGTLRIIDGIIDMGVDEFCAPGKSLVHTLPATNVDITTVTLEGLLYQMGTATSVIVSFEYGTVSGSYPYKIEAVESPMDATGSFHTNINGLIEGQTYYYRTKVIDSETYYGAMEEVTLLYTLEVEPTHGTNCSPITITGYNYLEMPGTISMGSIPIQDVGSIAAQDIDGDGQFDDFRVTGATVPCSLRSGMHTINTGSKATNFTVEQRPISITPGAGPPGRTVTINGTDWYPGTQNGFARLLYGNGTAGINFITSINVDHQGNFSATGQIPLLINPDIYSVIVCFNTDNPGLYDPTNPNCIYSQCVFTVTPRNLVITPINGIAMGETVCLSGGDFGRDGKDEQPQLYVNYQLQGLNEIALDTMTSYGDIVPVAFDISNDLNFHYGENIVEIRTNINGLELSAVTSCRIVRPTFEISSNEGPCGTEITGTGSGWPAGDTNFVEITCQRTDTGTTNVIGVVKPNANGEIWTQFKTPLFGIDSGNELNLLFTATDGDGPASNQSLQCVFTITGCDYWVYDMDQDGSISKQEILAAVVDFFAGHITKQQALEVIVLFFS